jgi:hypothetical protein
MKVPLIEKESYTNYNTFHFLFILTVIQFWWIAIWGIAYIVIDIIAGPSKMIELFIGTPFATLRRFFSLNRLTKSYADFFFFFLEA